MRFPVPDPRAGIPCSSIQGNGVERLGSAGLFGASELMQGISRDIFPVFSLRTGKATRHKAETGSRLTASTATLAVSLPSQALGDAHGPPGRGAREVCNMLGKHPWWMSGRRNCVRCGLGRRTSLFVVTLRTGSGLPAALRDTVAKPDCAQPQLSLRTRDVRTARSMGLQLDATLARVTAVVTTTDPPQEGLSPAAIAALLRRTVTAPGCSPASPAPPSGCAPNSSNGLLAADRPRRHAA